MKKIIFFTLLVMTLLLAACSSEADAPTDVPSTESQAEPTSEPETEEVEAPAESVTVDMAMLTGTTWAWTAFTDPTQQFDSGHPAELHPDLPG